MPDLTITVTDAQVTRIKAALGSLVHTAAVEAVEAVEASEGVDAVEAVAGVAASSVWTPATDEAVAAAILANLKRVVSVYSNNSATSTAISDVGTTLTEEGW
tara:strand:+ start:665 stop:970 length:306 start_codon:yes stop_codon:yes gene_type:complete